MNTKKDPASIESSLLKKAIENDREAIITMFQQFIPPNEEIFFTEYLGLKGLWGLGDHSFACLTSRRVADMSVSTLGEVLYQDAYLEFINSTVVYQPSKFYLYFVIGIVIVISIPTFGLLLITLPLIVRIYYGMVKCGLYFWVREGVPVYIFTNRKLLRKANLLCRSITIRREKRLQEVKFD